jgi:hypothetical protein
MKITILAFGTRPTGPENRRMPDRAGIELTEAP